MYSVTEAARAVGRSKATIIRAIASGTLSATRDDPGKPWRIDPAELARAFPDPVHEPDHDASRTAVIREKDALIAAHEGTIADLRRRLDAADTDRRQALFFERLAHRLVAEFRYDLQLHHPFGQEPQRPALLALGRPRAGQRHQLGLLRTVQLARVNAWARPGPQRRLQPLLNKALPHPPNRAHADPYRFGNLRIRPVRSAFGRVRLQQHPRMRQLARVRLAARDHATQHLTLLRRQRHPVPLHHRRLPPPCHTAEDRP